MPDPSDEANQDAIGSEACWDQICKAIESAWPVSHYRDVGVLVGCSGGADSVALLVALADLIRRSNEEGSARGFLIAAHFNHGFRGDESDGDAAYVRSLAESMGIRFEIRKGQATRSDEAAARHDRREFFRETMSREGCRYLALAHNLDDNVETVLYRLLRGTGPAGLAGISRFREFSDCTEGRDFVIARPMLEVGRRAIREALRQRGIRWREDSSNSENEYHRNWIRNELIPSFQVEFPNAVSAIARAVEGQRGWESVVHSAADRWLDYMLVRDRPLTVRRLDQIAKRDDSIAGGLAKALVSPAVCIEALRKCWLRNQWPLMQMDQSRWHRLVETLSGRGPDSIYLPGKIFVSRESTSVTLIRED